MNNALVSAISAIIAFLVTALLGIILVPFLHKLKFGQTIREEGPSWHQKKSGTPTMGGIMIILGLLSACVLGFTLSAYIGQTSMWENTKESCFILAGIGLAVGMGLIGFLDDYIKVVKKRNLGLTAKQKTILQLLCTVAYLSSLALSGMSTTWLPFFGDIDITSGVGLIFWPIALLFVYGFTNAVNLTDGIDGLASTVTLVVCCGFMLASAYVGLIGTNIYACAGAGACLGFLVWNSHPAKVFMGDTGSLFLGGLVVSLSFAMGRPIVLLAAGIVYLIEAFSVMLQVVYYKKTKKRLFKMAPIHHHFEMSGFSEERIVLLFSAVTAVGCFVALIPIIF